jgi:hypothetical protein
MSREIGCRRSDFDTHLLRRAPQCRRPPATGKRFVYIAAGAQNEATAWLHGCHLRSRGRQYAGADHKCDRLVHPKRDLDAMAACCAY